MSSPIYLGKVVDMLNEGASQNRLFKRSESKCGRSIVALENANTALALPTTLGFLGLIACAIITATYLCNPHFHIPKIEMIAGASVAGGLFIIGASGASITESWVNKKRWTVLSRNELTVLLANERDVKTSKKSRTITLSTPDMEVFLNSERTDWDNTTDEYQQKLEKVANHFGVLLFGVNLSVQKS